MIVHNFNVLGAAIGPAKTHPVLIIDPDTVLTRAITPQLLQQIGGWDSDVTEDLGLVQLVQLALRDGPEFQRASLTSSFRRGAVEDVLATLVGEGPNHMA